MRARADVRQVLSAARYSAKLKKLYGSALVGYRQLAETSGATAYDSSGQGNNGVYNGASLAHLAAPPRLGGMAPFFDGVNDNVNLYSAAFAADVNLQKGTIGIWVKVANAGVWTDGQTRAMLSMGNGSYYVTLRKNSTSNQVMWLITLSLGIKNLAAAFSSTDWFHMAVTYDSVANEYKCYLNGAQSGATQTGAGQLTGLQDGRCYVAMRLSGGEPFHGWLCHETTLNRAATAAELLQQYSWGV
jgi:hypothetical protein